MTQRNTGSTTKATRRRRATTTIAFVAGAALMTATLSACGSSTPSRDAFIDELRTTLGDDLTDGAGLTGVDTKKLNEVVNNFLGCTYDAIKDDTDLLDQMMKDPSFSTATTGSSEASAEQQATLNSLTTSCVTELNKQAAEVLSGEE